MRSAASGSRTIVNYNDLPEMTVGEFVRIAERFRDEPDCWFHFEVRKRDRLCPGRYEMADLGGGVDQGRIPETTLQCVRHLRKHLPHAKISVEMENPTRTGMREVAAEASVVFYSKTWAEVRKVRDVGSTPN